MPEEEIEGSIRFSLGWSTTPDEVDDAVALIQATVSSLLAAESGRI